MMRRALLAAVLSLYSACTESPPPRAPQMASAPDAGLRRPPREISVTSKSPEAVKAFKEARALLEGARIPEGLEAMRKALKLDEGFPLALAYVGFFTPSEEGVS